MASDELRRQADNFVDLNDLAEIVCRPSRLPRFVQEPARTGDRARQSEPEEDVDADA
jgi:hypothetical protein